MRKTNSLFQITFLALIIFLMSTMSAMGQGTTIKGNVIDSNGEPLIGATVTMKGDTKVLTVTDFDGNFVLHVPRKNVVLVISYVGMLTKEIQASGGSPLKIMMKDDTHTLNETVVVGYGHQKKVSVVGAITQTDGKVLERTGGVSSLGAALTGNLPGVITMSSSGMPGDEDPQIVIRGVSSWNNSQPLILVDGIERPMGSIDISSVKVSLFLRMHLLLLYMV